MNFKMNVNDLRFDKEKTDTLTLAIYDDGFAVIDEMGRYLINASELLTTKTFAINHTKNSNHHYIGLGTFNNDSKYGWEHFSILKHVEDRSDEDKNDKKII